MKDKQIRKLTGSVLTTRKKEKSVYMQIGIVSDQKDSYGTIIDPDGLATDLRNVPVDFNHERVATGAEIINDLGIRNVEIEVKGEKKDVKMRVVEIKVPENAKMWTSSNRDTNPENVGNLYNAVVENRVRWVSVDFTPIRSIEENELGVDGVMNKIVTTFKEWRLNFLSLLDTAPGQNETFILDKNIRGFNFLRVLTDNNLHNLQNRMEKKEVVAKLQEGMENKEAVITGLTVMYADDSDSKGTIGFMADEKPNTAEFEYTEEGLSVKEISEIEKVDVPEELEEEEREAPEEEPIKEEAKSEEPVKEEVRELTPEMMAQVEEIIKKTVEELLKTVEKPSEEEEREESTENEDVRVLKRDVEKLKEETKSQRNLLENSNSIQRKLDNSPKEDGKVESKPAVDDAVDGEDKDEIDPKTEEKRQALKGLKF